MLDAIHDSQKNVEKKTMRERKAAGGLFNWEVAYLVYSIVFVASVIILLKYEIEQN